MMKMMSKAGGYLLQPSRYQFAVLNNANVGRDAEVSLPRSRTLFSRNIQSSTTPSMPWLWAQEEQDSELPLGWSSKDLRPPVSLSSSRPDHTQLLLKEVSTQP